MKKLVEKSFYAKFMSWFLANKPIIFTVLGTLFWGIAVMGIYNNIVWFWTWSDLFISLIMFVFGFLFFPFSFSWQKQMFGTSFNTIGLFSMVMFFVFTMLTFSVLQEIFQGDFIFTIWSILTVIFVLFWWVILIPKSSLLLTKYIGIKFSILRNQGIFIVFIVVFSIDIIGISNSSSSIDYDGNSSVCLGSESKLHSDDRIDVYITDSNTTDGIRLDKDIFSIEELSELYYSIKGQKDKDQYYFSREICNLDTNKSLLDMFDGGIQIDSHYPGSNGGYGGNISSFSNRSFDSGNYALNVFVSDDDKSWRLVKVLEFNVE